MEADLAGRPLLRTGPRAAQLAPDAVQPCAAVWRGADHERDRPVGDGVQPGCATGTRALDVRSQGSRAEQHRLAPHRHRVARPAGHAADPTRARRLRRHRGLAHRRPGHRPPAGHRPGRRHRRLGPLLRSRPGAAAGQPAQGLGGHRRLDVLAPHGCHRRTGLGRGRGRAGRRHHPRRRPGHPPRAGLGPCARSQAGPHPWGSAARGGSCVHLPSTRTSLRRGAPSPTWTGSSAPGTG